VGHIRVVLAAVMMALPAFSAFASSRNEVTNAVVMVAVGGHAADGTSVNRNGTGFIVANSRYVITANHVVVAPGAGPLSVCRTLQWRFVYATNRPV
jgi:S1-C subfamily serine protease